VLRASDYLFERQGTIASRSALCPLLQRECYGHAEHGGGNLISRSVAPYQDMEKPYKDVMAFIAEKGLATDSFS